MNICGLDFGTSNSTIGVLKNNRKLMVPLEKDTNNQWQTTLPSALFFSFDDDRITFGREGIRRYTAGEPGRMMRSMKNIMGSSLMNDDTQVKRQYYSFDEIISFFVESLKARADEFRGENADPLDTVVMGRPVFFNDTDEKLDREAQLHLETIAKKAGFSHVSFQYEPIAAAFEYEQRVQQEELALIVDIGGGTSDFTIVRLSPDRHQLTDRKHDFLANHGVHVGGTDFDRRLSLSSVMSTFGMGQPLAHRPTLSMPGHYYFDLATWHKVHLLYDRAVLRELEDLRPTLQNKAPIDRLIDLLGKRKGHRLATLVEAAKIELSTNATARIEISGLLDSLQQVDDCTISRAQLEQALQQDCDRIFSGLDDALLQAGLTASQIDTVFTTGGSTALPLIRQRIAGAFTDAKIIAGDLYNSVGAGLLTEAVKRYT